jgi:hypothetical protein
MPLTSLKQRPRLLSDTRPVMPNGSEGPRAARCGSIGRVHPARRRHRDRRLDEPSHGTARRDAGSSPVNRIRKCHGPQRHARHRNADHHPDRRRARLLGRADPEDRQVERFALAEPDNVAAVVGKVVAGRGVGEDRQPGAVNREPGRDVAEHRRRNGDLA